MLELNDEAIAELRKIDQFDFDIFKLRRATRDNELVTIVPYVLARHGLIGACAIELNCLFNFVKTLQSGYKNITYHNKTHAADVCQTFNYFATNGGIKDVTKMDNMETMSCLIAASMHDYEHPGVNNMFLVNISDSMAVKYNDRSVLENHHIAASFSVMYSDPQCNWTRKMSRDEFKRVRHMIIETVLTTDMTKHFLELGLLSSRLENENFNPADSKDKELLIKIMFHLSDISNPVKDWRLCKLWTELLFVEFFAQGDMEKMHGLEVSQLCCRTTTNVAKTQIGFIDFIITPSFNTAIRVFPKIAHVRDNCEKNKEHWAGLFDEYQKEQDSGNKFLHIVDQYIMKETKASRRSTLTQGEKKSKQPQQRNVNLTGHQRRTSKNLGGQDEGVKVDLVLRMEDSESSQR